MREADIAALEARTEGLSTPGYNWPEQVSMRERCSTAGFIQAFTGSHRFVLDYLAGEVLERQPEGVGAEISCCALPSWTA